MIAHTLSVLAFLSVLFGHAVHADTLDTPNPDKAPASPSISQEQRNIADALNYSQISIEIISAYNNRVVLDREYASILNNFNLRQIPDEKIVELMLSLMDSLTESRLTDRERERLDVIHARALKEALPSNEEMVTAGIKAGKAAASVVSAYTTGGATAGVAVLKSMDALDACGTVAIKYLDYQAQVEKAGMDKEDANWSIDNEVMKQINEINKKMLSTSWSLYNEYNIPEDRRLTQSDIRSLIEINRDRDLPRRFRLLSRPHMASKFATHAPYWYYLGSTAHEIFIQERNNDFREVALDAYDQYERNQSAIFKKDDLLASCILGKAQLLDHEKERADILACLRRLEASPPENWPSITTMALLYAKLGMYDKARSWVQHNIDSDSANRILHKQMLGRILIAENDYAAIDKLADQMIIQDKASILEILDMIGTAPSDRIVKLFEPSLLKVTCSLSQRTLRDDILVVGAPFSLHLTPASIALFGGNAHYDPESGLLDFAGEKAVLPIDLGSSDDKETVLYKFETSLIDDWIEEKFSHLAVVFSDERDSIKLLLDGQGIGRMDATEKAMTANISLVTVNGVQYFIKDNSLVAAARSLKHEFDNSVAGILHAYDVNHPKLLDNKTAREKYATIRTMGSRQESDRLYQALLADEHASYLLLCGVYGGSKDHAKEISELPFPEVSLVPAQDLDEKIKRGAKIYTKYVSYGLIDADEKLDSIENDINIELHLPGRWTADAGDKNSSASLQVEHIGELPGTSKELEDGNGVKFVFKDCYNQASWASAKVREAVVSLAGNEELIALSFPVNEDGSIDPNPASINVDGQRTKLKR